MINITYQDSDLIFVAAFPCSAKADGIFFKFYYAYLWSNSIIGDSYPCLFDRNKNLIVSKNEYYQDRYSSIEASLTGDVLILGIGLAVIDQYLATGSSWKWVDNNQWIIDNITPLNGTTHLGDANDIQFLETLGTFDTILIDYPFTQLVDYSSILNVGGTIIEFKL